MSVPHKKEITYIIIVILLLAVIIAQEFRTEKERKVVYLPNPYIPLINEVLQKMQGGNIKE